MLKIDEMAVMNQFMNIEKIDQGEVFHYLFTMGLVLNIKDERT